ncbi:hypothetical protein D9611_012062 [Ephemerocybe angulata]|uniref:N-acetyltransferase domain-containing protein n=1 Tax=Ephemerocybe angulata TaxID=980116 RepID=A0A8H5ATC4_9AGAR|nr:hypothetical protein D9611_012062 [Tulosesus angulatus]
MSDPTPFDIQKITVPISATDLSKYKELRLTSLPKDPQFFGSNYKREAAFSEQDWKYQLDSTNKATFIVKESNDKWIGTLTVLATSSDLDLAAPFQGLGVVLGDDTNRNIYAMVGLWVDSAFRSKGLGQRLIQQALSWAREHIPHENDDTAKIAILEVHRSNIIEKAMYQKCGFKVIPKAESGKGDTEWMIKDLDL